MFTDYGVAKKLSQKYSEGKCQSKLNVSISHGFPNQGNQQENAR